MSIVVSAIICVAWTLISPEKDKGPWARFKGIEVEDNEQVRGPALAQLPVLAPCLHVPSASKALAWGLGELCRYLVHAVPLSRRALPES